MRPCSRRCIVAAGLGLAACGPARVGEATDAAIMVDQDAGIEVSDASADCSPQSPDPDWTRIELADVPSLRTPGATAIVERSDQLLNVWVQHHANGCFTAVWRVCTHGACDVEPAVSGEWYCPCHGSRFGSDGRVLQGPATRPLSAFKVVRSGDALLLGR
jgi:cytochrome b6-f complex iron-sulfur subunit